MASKAEAEYQLFIRRASQANLERYLDPELQALLSDIQRIKDGVHFRFIFDIIYDDE